ncbi:uncharacterized protein LOC134253398 [Saccostrea cucullata]|uniref:uncharacterized protein LOC134253398 n=1 Tax=Saccostrea cuccullata TaxID=36930 RepID=UPI002ED4C987
MIGISGFNWSDAACEDLNAFICEKPAQLLNCDGEAYIVHLEPNKLTKISFPPFFDPEQPFLFPPYEKNLTCVWNILPPTGYRIVIDFYLLCNDDLKAFQGNTSFDNISCENSFGNYELEDLVLQLLFTTNSVSKLGSEQGFQFRFFATSLKGETTCDTEGVPLKASSKKQILTSPGFPLSKSASCVWTIVSPVHGSNIYVQFRYLNISNGGELQIWNFAWPHMNSMFSRSSVLDDSRTLKYSGEKIVLNYTSHDSTSGHHGFSLVFFTDEERAEICSQPSVTKELNKYGIINPEDKFMIFSVKASNPFSAIELSNSFNIELVSTGGESVFVTFHSNYRYLFPYTCIRKMNVTGACLERYDGIDLGDTMFQDYWISWFDTLKVGRGRIQGENVIMDLRIYNPMSVNFSSVQSERDTSWNFYGSTVRTDFVEICHTSIGRTTEPFKRLWGHQLPVRGYDYLGFSVKACERAIVEFQNTDMDFIRILFDTPVGESSILVSCITNSFSFDNIDECISDVYFGRVLNCTEYRDFWISWGGGSGMQVGEGKIVGTNTIIKNTTNFNPVEDSFVVGNDHSVDVSFSSLWLFDRPSPKPEIINITASYVVPSPYEVENTTLTMSAHINVVFEFQVKWFRNGILVTPSFGRYLIRQSFIEVMKCSLTILQLDLQDEVKPEIQIEILPHSGVFIQAGNTLNLVCNITNLDNLQRFSINVSLLTWYKDGIKIQENYNRAIVTTHRSSKTLHIIHVQQSDRGIYTCNHERYRTPGVKNVVVGIYNQDKTLCPSSMDIYGIFWPPSIPGTLVHSKCKESKQGNASRYCDYDGTWKETNVSNCDDEELSNAVEELQNLENEGIVDKEYIEKIFNSSLGVTENITASRSGISSGNLLACINILNIILNIATRSNASLPERDLYSIMNNILAIYNKEAWRIIEDEVIGSDSIFKIMDRMNLLLMNESQPVKFTGENIVVHINNVSLKDTDLRFLENDSFFVLPKQEKDTFQVTYYAAVLYKTMSQLLPNRIHHVSGSKNDTVINSVILALTLKHPILPLSPPLALTFQHNRVRLGEANCVFWSYSIFNNSGGWSTEGCSMNSTENGVSVCLCNHTTNFAVLMRPYTPEKEDSALVVISIVGCVLSMIFSLLTAAVFISNWKHIKGDKNVLIVILCVSLFLVYLTLLAGIDNAQNEATCAAVTFLLHFFLLLTFFLMLGVGLYHCMNVTVLFYAMAITNRFNSRSRLKLILGTTTCISLVIVFLTLGSCWETQYHAEKFCWLSVSSGAIYAFIVPLILIFLMNICIIASLLRVMFLTTKMKKAEFKEKVRNALKSVCTLVPVLGIAWIFGIFAINEDLVAFQYIFTIANSIQGLLIFITQVLLNRKIRNALLVKYPFLKRKRDKTTAKEKYRRTVSSTGSENTIPNTQRTGITNSSYVDYKDPKEFESTTQLQAERKISLTSYGNTDSDNHSQEISTETQVMKKLVVSLNYLKVT